LLKQKIEEYERRIKEITQTWTEKNEELKTQLKEKVDENNKLVKSHKIEIEALEDKIRVIFY